MKRLKLKYSRILMSMISVIIFLLIWELLGRNINPIFASYPTEIIKTFFEMLFTANFLNSLTISIVELIYGFGLSILLGVPIGLLIGKIEVLENILGPFINAFYGIPRIVFIPLIILWFGLALKAKIVMIILLAIFPIIINTISGVKNIDKSLIETAKAFGANEKQVIFTVILPGSLPFIMTGIKLGAGMAIIGMILGEMFTALTGLGALLIIYANRFQTSNVFVIIFVLAVLSLALIESIRLIEKKIMPWKASIH